MQLCLRHPERCTALVLPFPLAFAPGRAQLSRASDSVRLAGQPSLFTFVIKTTLHSDFLFWAATKLARNTLVKDCPRDTGGRFPNGAEGGASAQAPNHAEYFAGQPARERNLERRDDRPLASPLRPGANPRAHPFDQRRGRLVRNLPQRARRRRAYSQRPLVGYPTGGHLLLGHWKEACAQVVGFLTSHSAKEHSVAQ